MIAGEVILGAFACAGGALLLAALFTRKAKQVRLLFLGLGLGLLGTGIVRIGYGFHQPWATLELGSQLFVWPLYPGMTWLCISGAVSSDQTFAARQFMGTMGIVFPVYGILEIGREMRWLSVDPEFVAKILLWPLIASMAVLLIASRKPNVEDSGKRR